MSEDLAAVQLREVVAGPIGARGDAAVQGLWASYVLPGERVRGRARGDRFEVVEVVAASAERVAPPCPHFTRCGGCAVQHWADGPLAAWKRDLVVAALRRQAIDTPVHDTIAAWGAGRRRAAFHARKTPSGLGFGFAEVRSRRLVDVMTCPVLTPGLAGAIGRLRALAEALAPRDQTVTLAVTETLGGLDVDLRGAGGLTRFGRTGLEALAAAADAADVARLSLDGETAIQRRPPVLALGPARVVPPPGAFLQATVAGEEALAALVLAAATGATLCVDLFAGLGTFALRLKSTSTVRAYEADPAATAALKAGADGLAGGKTLSVVTRDLFRNPVGPLELKGVDAVVFDPPRAGAQAQAAALARSRVPVVVGVSCDPHTFARDARLLIDDGYRLDCVTPVDQFRWAAHVELVGVFRR